MCGEICAAFYKDIYTRDNATDQKVTNSEFQKKITDFFQK